MIKTTKARIEFKNKFGQANHFLITALIGVDGIEKGIISGKPAEFSTSWNPKDSKRSAQRTRLYIINSFLGSAVDALDMYLTLLNRSPKLLQDVKYNSIYDEAKRSVHKKAMLISEALSIDKCTVALVDVLIAWRNNILHHFAENEIRPQSKLELSANANQIRNNFSGLDINLVLEKYEKGDAPSFKEAASLIRASHNFVELVDEKVISLINLEEYCKDAIRSIFSENAKMKQKYFCLTAEDRYRYIENIFKNKFGFDQTTVAKLKGYNFNVPIKATA